jgi:hypothetical protein
MLCYHCTTSRKLDRYKATGAILPPVRFWPNLETAQKWARKTGRDVILMFNCGTSYPLPDHKPARWTPEVVRNYDLAKEE